MVVELKRFDKTVVDVSCDSCGACFCFNCTKEAHQPVSCELLAQWKEKVNPEGSQEDSDTWTKLVLKAKKCPMCGIAI